MARTLLFYNGEFILPVQESGTPPPFPQRGRGNEASETVFPPTVRPQSILVGTVVT
jgi:hypothetical protein